jgi:fructose-1,6-bisphosphatase
MASDVSVECGTLAMRYVEKLKSLITHAMEVSKRHGMLVEPNMYYLTVKSLDEAVDELVQKTGKSEEEVLLALREEFDRIRKVAESLLIVATLALDRLEKAKRAA